MARLTKPRKQETVTVFYGINRMLDVERVSLDRGGTLSRWGRDANLFSHHVGPNRHARSEVVIVFNLTDIIEMPPMAENDASNKQRINELEEKAARMRADRDAKSKDRSTGGLSPPPTGDKP
jgi:hypothetical protein